MSGLEIQHKRNYHAIRWGVAIVVMTLLAAYAYFGVRWYSTGEVSPLPLPVSAADNSIDETPVSKKAVDAHTVAPSHPRYIEIPTVGVEKARVTSVRVTPQHMLDVPKNIDDTGWYAKSATPGSGSGAVVIDGHNGGVSRNGVFARIGTLKKGAQITIERGDGERFAYEVYDVRDEPLEWVNKTGMKEMLRSAEPAVEGLSLITRSGKWIPKDKVFDRRILVRATLIDS